MKMQFRAWRGFYLLSRDKKESFKGAESKREDQMSTWAAFRKVFRDWETLMVT